MTIPWSRRAWVDDPEPPEYDDEPIGDDCMAEDYLRAIDEINGLYPPPLDHDRRYDDLYSQQQGDLGDNEIPF